MATRSNSSPFSASSSPTSHNIHVESMNDFPPIFWKLFTTAGRQVWHPFPAQSVDLKQHSDAVDVREIQKHFEESKKVNPNAGDEIWRVQQKLRWESEIKMHSEIAERPTAEQIVHRKQNVPLEEIERKIVDAEWTAISFFQKLQTTEGHWPGDYGGPMFLLPGAIITLYVTQTLEEVLGIERMQQMIRYMFNHQDEESGAWGIHIESKPTQFGTVMQYVALRILGVPKTDKRMEKAKKFIHQHGGALTTPSWGKFWLSVLGVFEWDGLNSLLPELWILPYALPIHPARWWCHCRMVYLPMAYAYGARITCRKTPLIEEMRSELYVEDYNSINWSAHRSNCAAIDVYYPQTKLLKVVNFFANTFERFAPSWTRQKALDFIISYVHAEDDQTHSIDIGPVNKFANMLCVWHRDGPVSQRFADHKERVLDYMWLNEDGMKCQGYNGSQLWDTAFTVQGIVESGFGKHFPKTLERAYHYIDISQVPDDVKDRVKFFRHISKGGWPFSTLDHGWPITDCTAEGLKASIALNHELYNDKGAIDEARLNDAVNVILSFQNSDGGWATYELTRSYPWLELINPAEVFGGIMIDYSYTECSSACITALCSFRRKSSHRKTEIDAAIAKGIQFIRSRQLPNGSWYGSWAVCFTYGTWFGVEALVEAGYRGDPAVNCACEWLISVQNIDGGWGESYLSCALKRFVPHEHSQIVNTAWAVMTLIKAEWHDHAAILRGVEFLLSRQLPNGDWPQEGISGQFNNSVMISYTNYRCLFPIWAIGRYIRRYIMD